MQKQLDFDTTGERDEVATNVGDPKNRDRFDIESDEVGSVRDILGNTPAPTSTTQSPSVRGMNPSVRGLSPSVRGRNPSVRGRNPSVRGSNLRSTKPKPVKDGLDLRGDPTVGQVLKRIRDESRSEAEKGRWFENLFLRVAKQQPELDVENIWRWEDWPEREELLPGRNRRDIGVDLVARLNTGEYVAIQCKCYKRDHKLSLSNIHTFVTGSQHDLFKLRWIVATCGRLNPNAQQAVIDTNIRVIDFYQYLDTQVKEEDYKRPPQKPWRLQPEAIENTVKGLRNHDRGRLIMACGSGKTFVSLRVAEQTVPDGGSILFAAPSIALVAQARKEWLRHSTRKIKGIVVCSDRFAGGKSDEDIKINELECDVTTSPAEIAEKLGITDAGVTDTSITDAGVTDTGVIDTSVTDTGVTDTGGCAPATRVVFCTYQSLARVTEAQAEHGAPAFDLAIADEAHRTTGAVLEGDRSRRKTDFQEFHDESRLKANKRLYMTATPRLYKARSKANLQNRGITVVDMSDHEIYGPVLHNLSFRKAVENDMLSDYRVIVLGVNETSVTPGLKKRLSAAGVKVGDMTKVLGVSLAVNAAFGGSDPSSCGQASSHHGVRQQHRSFEVVQGRVHG